MNTDLEITLEFLDSPTEVDFYAVAGVPGHDGADGQDGAPGRDGADGHTPVITASKVGKTTTISVDGDPIAQILDGADGAAGAKGDKGDKGDPGQDGAKGDKGDTGAKGDKGDKGDTGAQGIQGIQGEKGETGAKGDKGDKGDTGATGAAGQDGHTPVKGTDYWTAEDKAEIVAEAAGAVDIPVTDVQVNGTSVLSSGVANILMANYVGELLYDETTTEDLTELIVQTDLSGQPFEVMKLIAIFTASQSTTGARDNFYGSAYVNLPNGNNVVTSFPSMTYPTATSTMMARITLTVYPNMPIEEMVVIGSSEGNTANMQMMPKHLIVKSIYGIRIYQSASTKSLIPAGSRLTVYGIRA